MKAEKRRMSILTLRLCYLLEARTKDNPRNVTTTARIILVLAMFKNENTRIFVSGKHTVNRLLVSCINEPVHEISNNLVYATSKGSDQPAHTRRLIRAFASRLSIL